MTKERIIELLKKDKKIALMLIIGLIGILLIAVSELIPKKENVEEVKSETEFVYKYETGVEERLCGIISKIDGAGRVEVMVTLKSSEENRYAFNTSSQSKNDDGLTESKSENEYVIVDGASGDECVLVKTDLPQVQGVIVVCEGGEDNKIKNDITNAVSALLNINKNNISVLKMKSTEE